MSSELAVRPRAQAQAWSTATELRTASAVDLSRREVILVAVLALLVGGLALAWSMSANLVLAYSDALSHLNIARRLVDSRTPGVTQLGTVWLPVPHVLMLPFVWIDPLWRSGLAGSLVGLGGLAVTAVARFAAPRLLG